MATFLHISDIHLGYSRYNNGERTKDFFRAFQDCIQRYALDQPVDFVLIVGDIFEHRSIQPSTLNQAHIVLETLKEANIPVLAIEGNHDNCPYGVKTSWLRYLAEQELLMLLEPEEDSESIFLPWDAEYLRGGYIDLDCGVRVLGSRWYGASTPQAVQKLAAGIAALPPFSGQTVMMLHHGLEGQVARYTGALRYQDLLPLKTAGVDYLALGHIHKSYTEQGWIFNAGSLEANSVAENQKQTPRGGYRVELTSEGIRAELKRDYYQRSIYRLVLEAQKDWSQAQVEHEAIALLERENAEGKLKNAIVELRIQGQVGFNRLDLNLRSLQERLEGVSQALIFLLKYEVSSITYAPIVSPSERISREAIEANVFETFLAGYQAYEGHLQHFTRGLMDFKQQVLSGDSVESLYAAATAIQQGAYAPETDPSTDP